MKQLMSRSKQHRATHALAVGAAVWLAAGACMAAEGDDVAPDAEGSTAANPTDAPPAQPATELDGGVPLPDASAAPDAGADDTQPRIVLEDTIVNGTKCKAKATLGPDGQTVLIDFDALQLAGVETTELQTCHIATTVRTPPGYAFTLESIAGKGDVSLPAGVKARFTSSFYFHRSFGGNGTGATTFTGPREGAVEFGHVYENPGYFCGNTFLDLTTRVVLENPEHLPNASVKLDSLELARFALKPCAPGEQWRDF